MKAKSKMSPSHSHSENGIVIQFKNRIFETDNPQEIAILEKYNDIYWKILREAGKDTTEEVKVAPQSDMSHLNEKKRHELYTVAKEKGFEGNFIGSTKEELINFLNK